MAKHNEALLVIDMINDYLTPEGLVYCKECRGIIPKVADCIEAARKHGVLVVYLNTCLHDESDMLASKWGLHAVEGTHGAAVIGEISPRQTDLVVHKKSYNGFFRTSLHEDLQSRNVSKVTVAGIHTHVCVLLTATAAFEYGYDVTVLEDCITTGYLPNHETRLRFFRTHVGELVSASEWMGRLS